MKALDFHSSAAGTILLGSVGVMLLVGTGAAAHGVEAADARFLESSRGPALAAYLYLGAKHMVTGYDHLLFLVAVLMLVTNFRDVLLYVTCFSVGHSLTLLTGVLSGLSLSPYIVDAVIGLSIVYKAFDNLGGFQAVFGMRPPPAAAILCFGLVHGFGLSTKLQDLSLDTESLVANMLAFNLGVEAGQVLALALILGALLLWRGARPAGSGLIGLNVVLMTLGFALCFYQLGGLAYGAPA